MSENLENGLEILGKIAIIREHLQIEKSGYNERNDYYYFKAEDVAAGVRAAMVKAGVIHQSKILQHTVENIVDKQGRVRPSVSALYEIRFVDSETGQWMSVNAVAMGSDIGGDLATRKMAVQAFKIAAIDTFTVVEDMGKVDSDNYAPAPSLNEGAEEEASSDKAPAEPTVAELTGRVTEIIKDPDTPDIDTNVVTAVGRRIGKVVLGEAVKDKEWRVDARVLVQLVDALEKGELA